MSVSPYSDLRNGAPPRDLLDDKMEQIRELLYGEFKRDNDARIALLESRVRELEAGLHRKLDAIQARLDSLGSEIRNDRTAAFDELAASVTELGDKVRRISRT
ncbi:MAG: hypothetical protein ACKVP7_29065 [Hyphomicrobiaceae bacterium]